MIDWSNPDDLPVSASHYDGQNTLYYRGDGVRAIVSIPTGKAVVRISHHYDYKVVDDYPEGRGLMFADNEPEDKQPTVWEVGTRGAWFIIDRQRVPVSVFMPIVYHDPYPEPEE